MEKLALNSVVRSADEKVKDIRASKKIPAVVYGHKFAPKTVSLDYSEFLKTYRVAGNTHIIKLSIDGKNQDVLVHEVQFHPVTWDFQHIDFMAIDAKEKIHVNIPLKLIGNSPAVREGWIVDQLIDEVEVKCFPSDLVDHFEYDISALVEVWQVAHFSELNIDTKKYETHLTPEAPIVSILEPKVSAEEEVIAPGEVPSAQDEKKEQE